MAIVQFTLSTGDLKGTFVAKEELADFKLPYISTGGRTVIFTIRPRNSVASEARWMVFYVSISQVYQTPIKVCCSPEVLKYQMAYYLC